MRGGVSVSVCVREREREREWMCVAKEREIEKKTLHLTIVYACDSKSERERACLLAYKQYIQVSWERQSTCVSVSACVCVCVYVCERKKERERELRGQGVIARTERLIPCCPPVQGRRRRSNSGAAINRWVLLRLLLLSLRPDFWRGK